MMKPRVRVKAASRALLTVVPFPEPVTDPDIVKALGSFRALADEGRLVSIAIAAVNRNGDISTAYAYGRGGSLITMAGAVAVVERRILLEFAS